jgi:RimJ/RimL family protein N-acetyltransferase
MPRREDAITSQVRLRPLEREDLHVFVEWFADPEVLEFLGLHNPLSQAREEKWFDKILEGPEDEHPFAIEVYEGGGWRVIGNIAFFGISTISRNAEIGIVLGDKSVWGRGCGTEAMRLMVDHGFKNLNLHRIHLQVVAENTRGIRCYEKVGFQHEGRQRDDIWKNGRFHDVLRMSILFPEWESSRKGE